ncbi:hypothetical protein HDU96_010544 [Phlyctochytrium bullatum]|nr:hypothetical protein HDU96_010544 [Phlyctochytrium bullatum]
MMVDSNHLLTGIPPPPTPEKQGKDTALQFANGGGELLLAFPPASSSLTPRREATDRAARHAVEVLEGVPIAAVLKHRRIRRTQRHLKTEVAGGMLVAVEEDMPMGMVLGVMKRSGVVSLPVFRVEKAEVVDVERRMEEGKGARVPSFAGKREYLGMVCLQDILGYTVFQKVFDKIQLEQTEHAFSRWLEIDADVKALFQTPIRELLPTNLSTRSSDATTLAAGGVASVVSPPSVAAGQEQSTNRGWTLRASDSVASLVRALCLVHRVMVSVEEGDDREEVGDLVDVTGESVVGKTAKEAIHIQSAEGTVLSGQRMTIVSQSDLLGFLLDYKDFSTMHSTVLFSSKVPEILAHRDLLRKLSLATAANVSPFTTLGDASRDYNQPSSTPIQQGRQSPDQTPTAPKAPTTMTLPPRRVLTVPASVTALTAFRKMFIHRITALPVMQASTVAVPVGGEEQETERADVVATLSVSDFRGVTADREALGSLLLPVSAFLRREREADREEEVAKMPRDVAERVEARAVETMHEPSANPDVHAVGQDDTLRAVIAKILHANIHRVWVHDTPEKLTGAPTDVVTLTDLLSFFLPSDAFSAANAA